MKPYLLLTFTFFLVVLAYSQTSNQNLSLSVSGGNFIIGKGYITGIWSSVGLEKRLQRKEKSFIRHLAAGGELYFESGADKTTVNNPTFEQFRGDRFLQESNTGITAKISYYPFGGIAKGFHISAGPLIVYSIRSYEKRAQLIQYAPGLSVRMSELGWDNKLLSGYRVTAGYDIYFKKHWLAGVRADFLQYHGRDLNSLLGLKAGYRF